MRRTDFTPSYDADTKEEYEKKVKEGKKRDLHVMIPSGRRGMRFGEGPEHQTEATEAARTYRWAEKEAPWDARTQALAVRSVWLTKEETADQIRRAIDVYSQGRTFLVPSDPQRLISAGMPKRAAEELVRRGAGNRYLRARPLPATTTWSLEVQTGSPLIEQNGQLGTVLNGTAVLLDRVSARIDVRDRTLQETIWEGGPTTREQLLETLNEALGALVSAAPSDAEISLVWHFVDSRTREKLPEVVIPLGEHSKFKAREAAPLHIDYRTLKNVPLDRLPVILTSLTGRVRREAPIRRNPSDGSVSVEELKKLHMLPVPGRPGYVYWWSETKGTIVQTTVKRAAAWEDLEERTRKLWAAEKSAGSGDQNVKENPMSHFDDDDAYWFDQYRQGQFGARQAVPVARRNGRQQDQARQAMKLYHSGQAPTLKQAWAMVKSAAMSNPSKAARNPWYRGAPSVYLPDTTNTGPALVPSQYVSYDDTERRSALVPGPYHAGGIYSPRSNPMHARFPGQTCALCGAEFERGSQIADSGLRGPRGGKKMAHVACVNKANNNPDEWAHHGHATGQFGISEELWQGMQPVNRRTNPNQATVDWYRNERDQTCTFCDAPMYQLVREPHWTKSEPMCKAHAAEHFSVTHPPSDEPYRRSGRKSARRNSAALGRDE